MKILFIGAFSNPWSSHHPMVLEMRKHHHKVFCVDYRESARIYKRLHFALYLKLSERLNSIFKNFILLPLGIRNLKYYLFGNWGINRRILYEVKKNEYDLVFLAKPDNLNYRLIPKINRYTNTWYYFMDPLDVAYRINAHKYAFYSTWSSASTRSMNALFKRAGAHSYYITQGFNDSVFKPNKNDFKKIDVIFVGTISLKRKKYIDYLKKNKINVVCYGEGWECKPIYLEDLANKYCQSKIILNFPRKDTGFSIRVFEALGTGSFLLSESCSDLEMIFKKRVHMDWFNSPEECVNLINYYLKNDDERENIAKNGAQFVFQFYTWEKIIEKIIDIVQNR